MSDRSRAAGVLPLAVYLLAVAVGAWLRLAALDLRPLHHDEGVNGLFLLQLARTGAYRYDPTNYHGPLLYFMVAPALRILGLTTFVLRLWPALIGIATLFAFLPLRALIGAWGAAAAAWLLALSPIAVYFSRDLIHESWFAGAGAMVGVGLAAAAMPWLTGALGATAPRRGQGWIVFAWIGFAFLVATKETAPLVVIAIASGAVAAAWAVAGRRAPRALLSALSGSRAGHVWGFLVATLVLAALFTSFFSHLEGFVDMFRAYAVWTKTGTGPSGHEKPWLYFFEILWRYERHLWVLGCLGMVVAALRREPAVGVGVAGVSLVLIHSVIPYKTPWLVLAALPWLAASAGYLVDRALIVLGRNSARVAAGVALAAILPFLGREAYRLSFVDYDDDHEAIIYSQTERGFLDLVASLRAAVLAGDPDGEVAVHVMSPEHFPLNWYVRDLGEVFYWGSVTPDGDDGVKLIARGDLAKLRHLGEPHMSETFPLRPGVELALAIPESLFEKARAGIVEPGTWRRVTPPAPPQPLAGDLLPDEPGSGLVARAADLPPEPGRPVHIDYDGGENDEWTPPHEIVWSGFLHAPETGLYRFALVSDDGSTLEIGDEMVVDNWGAHSNQRREGASELERGVYPVRIRYSDFGGGAKLRWLWRPPGAAAEEPVPSAVLSHQR